MKTFLKDPNATLDYVFDWDDWLAAAESINSVTVTADTGLTVSSSSVTGSGRTVTAWLTGGTVGKDYKVTCHITTDAATPRIDDRTILIRVRQR